MRKTREAIVHVIATCKDCRWVCQDYLTVIERAHAVRRRHNVTVDVGRVFEYQGKGVKP